MGFAIGCFDWLVRTVLEIKNVGGWDQVIKKASLKQGECFDRSSKYGYCSIDNGFILMGGGQTL